MIHVGQIPTDMVQTSPLQSRSSPAVALHGLEVVGLLDLGLSLLAHGLPQLLALVRGLDVVLHAAARLARQIDRLVLQRHLWRQRLEVALGQELRLERLLPLGR